MRYVTGRRGAGWGASMAVLGALLLGGCGLFANTDEVCGEATKALQQYAAQIKSAPAGDPRQWRSTTEQVAGRIDALAKKADDAALHRVLKEEATTLRAAAVPAGGGDVAALDRAIAQIPSRIGKVCS